MLKSLLTFIFMLISLSARAWNTPAVQQLGASYPKWLWTGAGGNTTWTNGANWCGTVRNGVCQGASGGPPSGAAIVFDGTCVGNGNNCTPTIPGGVLSFNGIMVKTGFTGTLDFGTSTVAIGDGGYFQAAGTVQKSTGIWTITSTSGNSNFQLTGGTFNGGSGNITFSSSVGGKFLLSGGTFTSTSGTLKLNCVTVDFTGLTTFNHNNGIVYFQVPGNNTTFNSAGLTMYSIQGSASNRTLNLAADVTMDGDFTAFPGGTSSFIINSYNVILRQGNLYSNASSSGTFRGTTVFKFTGSGEQDINAQLGVGSAIQIPPIYISQAVTGSVKLLSAVNFSGIDDSTTLGTINLNGQTTYANSGTWNVTTFTFPALTILNSATSYTAFTSLKITDLTLSGGSSYATIPGTISVYGNINQTFQGFAGHVTIDLVGTGTQTIDLSSSSNYYLPTLWIEKPSGNVVFTNTTNGKLLLTGDLYYNSGVGMSASAITMPTISDISFVSTQGSVITSGGFQFPSTTKVHFAQGATYSIADDMTILGNVSIETTATQKFYSSTATPHTVYVIGNIASTTNAQGLNPSASGGEVTFKLTGSAQTIDCTLSAAATGCGFPNLEIASSGGTTTLTGYIKVYDSYKGTSGTVDATGSTLNIGGFITTIPITVGSTTFGNVIFASSQTVNLTGTAVVNGTLTFNSTTAARTITGSIDAYGDVVSTGFGATGTATLQLKGNNSNFTKGVGTSMPTGTVTVAKNAGQTVTLGASLAMAAGQSMSVTGGTVDIASAAQSLTISGGGTLTLAAGTTVKLSGGTLSVGGSNIPAGAYSGGTVVP